MGPGWAPDASWEIIGGDEGAATLGVWRARRHDRDWVVKRLRPDPEHRDPISFRWWRREVAVVESEIGTGFSGLVAPESFVEEDEEGATLQQSRRSIGISWGARPSALTSPPSPRGSMPMKTY